MKTGGISVIIPVYNGEETLRQCLRSIRDQGYENYEVIVVDNNSTDKTREIVETFQAEDNRVRYILEEKRGRGAARRKGEVSARGDIILMTDSDCIVPSGWITDMIRPLTNGGKYDCVSGSQVNIANDFWSEQTQMRFVNKKTGKDKIIGMIDTKNFAIKKDSLEKVGFTSRRYFSGNDTELSIRLQKNGLRVKFLEEVAVRHYHANKLTAVLNKFYYRAYWCRIITRDHREYLKQTDFPESTNQTVWAFFKFFPGLIGSLIKKGAGWTYYEFVTGLAWRAGLIGGLTYKHEETGLKKEVNQ